MDSEDIAYDKGQNAQHDGYTLKDNPFKRFSPEWEQWKMGWQDMNNDDRYWKNVKRIQRNAFNRIKKTQHEHFIKHKISLHIAEPNNRQDLG